MEIPQLFEQVTKVFSQCNGFETIVVSHQGLIYAYSGSYEEAEKLAATVSDVANPSRGIMPEAKYVVLGSEEKAMFVASHGEFIFVATGARNTVLSHVEPFLRLVTNNAVRCRWCGNVLDLELYKCPRCGSLHVFTLPRCPICGNHELVKRCPRCGKLVDSMGRKLVRNPIPLATFVGMGTVLALLIYGIVGLDIPLIATSIVAPSVVGISMYLTSMRFVER